MWWEIRKVKYVAIQDNDVSKLPRFGNAPD